MKRLDAPVEAPHMLAAMKPMQGPAHSVTDFIQAQQGLLMDLGAALSCAMISMAVVAGVYFLLYRG
jgi:hypothetical protein